jgi:Protein of unknown function (DUF3108)
MLHIASAMLYLRHWRFMVKLLLVLLLCAPLASPQGGGGIPAKESFAYNIEWRLFNAGKAKVDITTMPPPHGENQINLHLESTGFVSKLYKVEDDYTAVLNGNMCAQSVQMNSRESNRLRETRITFDSEAKKANYLERDRAKNNAVILSQETEIPSCVHDVVGGLFFLRTLNLEPGQTTQVPVSDGKKSVMAKVEAQAREDVKTPLGTFKTIRYEVYLFNNVLYRRPAHLNIWITDDRRRIPVQIRVRMTFTIGTITLLLEKHDS